MAMQSLNAQPKRTFLNDILNDQRQRQILHRYLQHYVFVARPIEPTADEPVIVASLASELR